MYIIENVWPHHELVKKMTHYLNIIFRVSTLQSPTDIEKSSDPKIMELNARVRKERFEKLFRF